ncbi:MAG: hypothetical protein J6C46_00185 [Clostridia bacterium]|nr:hypothetical protein [Clostridia bacterium]
MYNFSNALNSCFGKVASGMCRVSMNGDIAIKTSQGYKTYNVETGHLLNCDDFAFELGSDFFFIIPTNKVNKGDIILAGGKPRCVIEVKKNAIETFCYEDSSISTIVPEHHMFMGKTYFYGKIVSMFGNAMKSEKGMGSVMKMMMMSQMFGGNKSSNGMDMSQMMPMMLMMNGGMDSMFESMFDFGNEEEDKDKTE